MNRRRFSSFTAACAVALLSASPTKTMAMTLNDLTNAQASQGLKAALEKGIRSAIDTLGQNNGFLGNDKVRIPFPGYLEDAAGLLRRLGQGARLDELSGHESRRRSCRTTGA